MLDGANSSEEGVDGQLLMCMKHLVETLWLQRKESEAVDMWRKAVALAKQAGITDQLRQLLEMARIAGWENRPTPPEDANN